MDYSTALDRRSQPIFTHKLFYKTFVAAAAADDDYVDFFDWDVETWFRGIKQRYFSVNVDSQWKNMTDFNWIDVSYPHNFYSNICHFKLLCTFQVPGKLCHKLNQNTIHWTFGNLFFSIKLSLILSDLLIQSKYHVKSDYEFVNIIE